MLVERKLPGVEMEDMRSVRYRQLVVCKHHSVEERVEVDAEQQHGVELDPIVVEEDAIEVGSIVEEVVTIVEVDSIAAAVGPIVEVADPTVGDYCSKQHFPSVV